MHIAAVQMEVADGLPAANRQALADQLDNHPGADLYLAPELWTCGYVQSQWARLAAEGTPASLAWIADAARRRGVWLGGSLIAADPDGALANRFVLFDRQGRLVEKPMQRGKFARGEADRIGLFKSCHGLPRGIAEA